MSWWRFEALWSPEGWLRPAYVQLTAEGMLAGIHSAAPEAVHVESVPGYALPGFRNAHSHAFQYAMAGLAEHLPADAREDDFWSWREAMYRLALAVSPDDLQAIATMLYAELARCGYTGVAEFHYLHHSPTGTAYDNPAEMGERLVAAAAAAGIAITLVPVYYNRGDFGKDPGEGQRRFIIPTPDEYFRLLDASGRAVGSYEDARLGTGVHSLRAASAADIGQIFKQAPAELPRHIHIAEQIREVENCKAFYGYRPVEWLVDNFSVDERYFLVHATHCSAAELSAVAERRATVVLCPSTEANLGDGFFPFLAYRAAGGSWAIGSDSHIGLSPMEELRWLDYGQRLLKRKRNILARMPGDDSGALAFRESVGGGRRALGENGEAGFTPGDAFDALVLDARHPLLQEDNPARWTSALIYACDAGALLGTLRRGEWLVRDGRHRNHESIRRRYAQALQGLRRS